MSKSSALKFSGEAESQVKQKRKIWNVCEYVWIVPDFDKLINKPVGYVIYSPDFKANADDVTSPVKWRLELYPSGDEEKAKDFIALYLCLKAASKFPVHIECELFIQNSNDEVIESGPLEHSYTKIDGFGYSEIVERDLLVENLIDNALKIRAHGRYSVDELKSFQTIDPDPKLANVWNTILENPKFADVVLVAESEEIKAHKEILSSRSPVFMAMFSHDLVENKSGKINISDFSANSIRLLMRFIYTNNIKIQDIDEAKSLFRAAEKYDIGDLKLLCLDYLKRKFTVSNVEDMLLFADMYNVSELKHCAIEYILNNPTKFFCLDQFRELAHNPNLISELFLKTLEKLAIK